MAKPANELTPMQRQYQEIKERNKDCILFFRLGDFYEMFNEDAKTAARELDLTLTTRVRGKPKEEQTPMCGVPYHSVDAYIARLVSKGYKVAICEQMEDPALAKGIVEREVTRIVTPGTVTESCMLEESRNNYIASLFADGSRYGLAFCDISTGEFYVTVCDSAASAVSELGRFAPSEVVRCGISGSNLLDEALFQRLNCCVDEGDLILFDQENAENVLEKHFGAPMADLGISGLPCAIRAAGGLLATLLKLQKNDLAHIRAVQYYTTGKFMELDLDARRNLELTESMRSKEKKGSLLWVLDKTQTAMGGRMIRSWLEKPLLDPAEIGRRHSAVEELRYGPYRHRHRQLPGSVGPGPWSAGAAGGQIPAGAYGSAHAAQIGGCHRSADRLRRLYRKHHRGRSPADRPGRRHHPQGCQRRSGQAARHHGRRHRHHCRH